MSDPRLLTGTGVKPRLRMFRGYWHCGYMHTNPLFWTCALTPGEAFELWKRSLRGPWRRQ